eukprot:886623-Prorocentrum_minimum.AAC.2
MPALPAYDWSVVGVIRETASLVSLVCKPRVFANVGNMPFGAPSLISFSVPKVTFYAQVHECLEKSW